MKKELSYFIYAGIYISAWIGLIWGIIKEGIPQIKIVLGP